MIYLLTQPHIIKTKIEKWSICSNIVLPLSFSIAKQPNIWPHKRARCDEILMVGNGVHQQKALCSLLQQVATSLVGWLDSNGNSSSPLLAIWHMTCRYSQRNMRWNHPKLCILDRGYFCSPRDGALVMQTTLWTLWYVAAFRNTMSSKTAIYTIVGTW